MNSYKIFIDSAAWMCEGNIIETSRIYRYLLANGHAITTILSEADFLIINSCGFVKEREELTMDIYEKCVSEKKENAKIIVFGCLIKIDKEKIDGLDVIPIDFNEGYKFDERFYTKVKYDDIVPYCDDKTTRELLVAKKTLQESKIISFFLSRIAKRFSKKVRVNYDAIMNRVKFKDKILIEICSGCIFQCRYCAIREAKGAVHSRPIASILSDIERLYDPSQDLFLVADDCGCYGLDIKTNLFNLLYEIHRRYPDLTIELDAINPYWLEKYPNEYLTLFRDVHIAFATIPIQSGSNKILKDMNRKYDVKTIQDLMRKIKKVSPSTAIYTHFIICYPGETFIDYLQSLYSSLFFDLPIVLEFSEHPNKDKSTLHRDQSKFTSVYRFTFFMLFLNVVILYKLLTFSNKR
jgi:ribosomal protein S12 methylthiotransferase